MLGVLLDATGNDFSTSYQTSCSHACEYSQNPCFGYTTKQMNLKRSTYCIDHLACAQSSILIFSE